MGVYIQILSLVIVGIVLLWLGYSIFLGPISPFYPHWLPWGKKKTAKGQPGDPQVCPLCSMKLLKGDLVKTLAYPSISGGRDRLMYIRGCISCLENDLPRRCPICGVPLSTDDYLVSRMFERRHQKNHVHVLGCNHCRKTSTFIK